MSDYSNFKRFLYSPIKRRNLIIGAGALSGFLIANQFYQRAIAQVNFPSYPFTLGVASGEPFATSVVLWTRLAPDPLNGGGMPAVNVPIEWQVATDADMRNIVAKGTEVAIPELAHSVRVEVNGLKPETWYWYQFMSGTEASPIGRTRTAPKPRSDVSKFSFALASCQQYQQGYFTAYKYMAQEDLDLVVHVGDYIYEGGISTTAVRQHNSSEIVTLDDYRNRHALYKTDPNLQAAHAAFPWIVTWDDHEVENNYADAISEIDSEPDQDRAVFLERRALAYQAYYEHMPLRFSSRPRGSELQLFRRLSFGKLATFHVLDTRQYRTDQPCGDGTKERCPENLDPNATILGKRQQNWLFRGLDSSQATWNILAQQVPIAQRDMTLGEGRTFSMDKWDGYVADRDRLIRFLSERKPSNPVSLAGDLHSNWAMDLKADFDKPESATVGSEFVCTSISSGGDGSDTSATVQALLPENPHIKFFNNQRGYVRCVLTPTNWQSDFLVMSNVTTQSGTISKRASFVVENGRPGVQQVH